MTYDRNATGEFAPRCDACSEFDAHGFAVDGPGECRVWNFDYSDSGKCDKCGFDFSKGEVRQ